MILKSESQRMIEYLSGVGTADTTVIAKATGIRRRNLYVYLARATEDKKVERLARGIYRIIEKREAITP
jgi:hypothetical protein